MALVDCSLFDGIFDDDVQKLYTCLNAFEGDFKSGEEVCSYDRAKSVLGVVISGKIIIKKIDSNGNTIILDTIEDNGVFSNVMNFTPTGFNFIGVYASMPTKVVFFDYNKVFVRCSSACECHSVFVKNLFEVVIKKSKDLSQRIEIISNKTIREKLLSYFSILAKKVASRNFTLPMSLTAIAEYICVDRSAMMRELKKLGEDGIIKLNKKNVTILFDEYI